MADFFSNLFSKITGLFKSKDLDSNIENFQSRMDTIISDLLLPYTNPEMITDPGNRFRDLLTLLDPKQCNKIAITLSNNLDKNYTKLQLEQFASNILVGKSSKDCNDESCSVNDNKTINNKESKVSKKEICNSIAVHYVKILNLISAILSAVNPNDNICLNRLRNLLTVISEDDKKGVSSICDLNSNIVKPSIMHESGFKELLMLYYYHLIQDTETEEEKTNVRNQYQTLVNTFSNIVMFVDPSIQNQTELNTIINNINNNTTENNNLSENSNSKKTNKTTNNNNLINSNGNASMNETFRKIQEEDELLNKSSNQNQQTSKNTATSKNIENIKQSISNLKEGENEQFANILTKIEGLDQIIRNIENKK